MEWKIVIQFMKHTDEHKPMITEQHFQQLGTRGNGGW